MSKETVLDKDENLSEEETSETTEQTVETTVEPKVEKTTEEDEKKEENPYEKEIKRLEDEKRQKEGALKEERRLRKEAEKALAEKEGKAEDKKYVTPEELEKALDEKLKRSKFEDLVEKATSDPNEQKLIRHHYENSIRRTGNLETDLTMAIAIANQHVVQQAKKAEQEREGNEAFMAKNSGGNTYGKPSAGKTDPISRGAAQFLKNLGASDATKHL